MKTDCFKEPVPIFVGLGYPAEIGSVIDAYRYLLEWPTQSRDKGHSVALNACRAALRGEVDAETARGLFIAFARRHDLLAPDTDIAGTSRTECGENQHVG